MKNIQITIDGITYKPVASAEPDCDNCALKDLCAKLDKLSNGGATNICAYFIDNGYFEREDARHEYPIINQYKS